MAAHQRWWDKAAQHWERAVPVGGPFVAAATAALDALEPLPANAGRLLRLMCVWDAVCKASPRHVRGFRRFVSRVLFPRLRAAVWAGGHPPAPVTDLVQHWLVLGLVRTPAALPGTGYFAAEAEGRGKGAPEPPAERVGGPPPPLPAVSGQSGRALCAVCGEGFRRTFHDGVNDWVWEGACPFPGAEDSLVHEHCRAAAAVVPTPPGPVQTGEVGPKAAPKPFRRPWRGGGGGGDAHHHGGSCPPGVL